MSATGPIRTTVMVANPFGLHMRPATAFAQMARAYRSNISVWNGDKRADGKSSLDLILLIAEHGTELVLEIEGDDAPEAVGPLSELLRSPGESH